MYTLRKQQSWDKDGKSTLKVSWFRDQDFNGLAATKTAEDINRTFVDGAQPDECLPANQPFSVKWEGDFDPTETGLYMIGVETDRGVRIHVNGEQLVDEYNNNKPVKKQRPIKLEAGKPVFCLGKSIYNLPGMTQSYPFSTLDDFWRAPQRPVMTLFNDFKRVLADRALIRGNFYTPKAMRYAAKDAVSRFVKPVISRKNTTEGYSSRVLR